MVLAESTVGLGTWKGQWKNSTIYSIFPPTILLNRESKPGLWRHLKVLFYGIALQKYIYWIKGTPLIWPLIFLKIGYKLVVVLKQILPLCTYLDSGIQYRDILCTYGIVKIKCNASVLSKRHNFHFGDTVILFPDLSVSIFFLEFRIYFNFCLK